MSKLILLADDDRASLELSRRALEQAGHLVVAASSGLEARRALDAGRFDVVVTDIFMPDMDGLELIRYICKSGRTAPIIAMSAGCSRTALGFLPVASALGADMVLQKPVLPSVLRRAVEEVAIDPSKGVRWTTPEPCGSVSAMLALVEPEA